MTADSATATLLGLDKRLRDEFIQPLKQCMVNKQEVNYQDLLEKVREIHKEVVGCHFRLDEQFYRRQKELTGKAKSLRISQRPYVEGKSSRGIWQRQGG